MSVFDGNKVPVLYVLCFAGLAGATLPPAPRIGRVRNPAPEVSLTLLNSFRAIDDGDLVGSITFSCDGKQFTCAGGHSANFWYVPTGKAAGSSKEGHSPLAFVNSVRYAPRAKSVLTAHFSINNNTVRLLDSADLKFDKKLTGHTGSVYAAAFSPDGKTIATGSYDASVRLWKVESGRLLQVLKGHSESVTCVRFSPDGKTVASGGYDTRVKLWKADSGKEIATLIGHVGVVTCLGYSPNGEMLFTGSCGREVMAWEVSAKKSIPKKALKVLDLSKGRSFCLAVDPTRELLYVGCGDLSALAHHSPGYIEVWDVSGWRRRGVFRVHSQPVTAIAISPDGNTLISGSRDGEIAVWKVVPIKGK